MSSHALEDLLVALAEVDALQRANPTPAEGGGIRRPAVVRALGRVEVVLLSGHFERYIYALNEEAVDAVLSAAPVAARLPEGLRLLHSAGRIDELAGTQWDRRAEKLRSYSALESALWADAAPVIHLEAERLLSWMKAPNCKSIVRFFKVWGITDIFSAMTRTPVNRQRLWLRIGELVEKRNNIAHGDVTVEANYLDIVQYKAAARRFCQSADTVMARAVARITGGLRPW